jgi:acyl dehydratase
LLALHLSLVMEGVVAVVIGLRTAMNYLEQELRHQKPVRERKNQ